MVFHVIKCRTPTELVHDEGVASSVEKQINKLNPLGDDDDLLDVNNLSHTTLDLTDSDSNDCDSGDDSSFHGNLFGDEDERVELECRLERKSTSSSTCTNSSRKSVRFSNVQIREYPLTIGDNPSCELGVPISIDWWPVAEHTTSVNDHQEAVVGRRPHNKTEDELRLPAQFRDIMVREAGFSSEQMRRAVHRVNVQKMERRATVDGIPQQSVEEAIERALRGLWNATVNRGGKQKEREMIQQWLKQDALQRQQKVNKSVLISAPF